MKRKKIINSMALLLCFGAGVFVSKLTSCGPSPIPPPPIAGTFDSCYSCNSKHCTIPLPDILTMIHKYGTDRSTLITNVTDSRAIVFDLESLKQYICKVESTVKENGLQDTYGLAGLKFYFTVYPSAPPYNPGTLGSVVPYMDGIPQDYREKHSLLIIPTYKLGSDYIDFDPQFIFAPGTPNNPTTSPIPMSMDSIPTTASILAYDPNSPCTNGLNSMNHGSMCPPTCPTVYSLLQLADQ